MFGTNILLEFYFCFKIFKATLLPKVQSDFIIRYVFAFWPNQGFISRESEVVMFSLVVQYYEKYEWIYEILQGRADVIQGPIGNM